MNVGAELRNAAVDGYIKSSQVRDIFKRLYIPLSEQELTFLAGADEGAPDDFVKVPNISDRAEELKQPPG
jgi:hypothetical protein